MTLRERRDLCRLPAGTDPVHHGYSLDRLAKAATYAVTSSYSHTGDYSERLEAAWLAVVEHLVAAADPPDWYDLVRAGQNAVAVVARAEHRDTDAPRATVYWTQVTRHTGDHAPHIVDQLAIRQILTRIPDGQLAAVQALADTDDHLAAAHRLGLTYDAYLARLGRARQRVLRLWHEGEAPSRPWGNDRRVLRHGEPPSAERRPATARRRRSRQRVERTRPGPAQHDLGEAG